MPEPGEVVPEPEPKVTESVPKEAPSDEPTVYLK